MREDKSREVGLDILRIMLAVMVITIHINAGGTGKVLQSVSAFPWKYLVSLVTVFCYPAVNCYILFTGFFSWNSEFDVKKSFMKVAHLWFCIVFFSIVGALFVAIIHYKTIRMWDIILRMFPLARGEWWFMTNYCALVLLCPFINVLIQGIDKSRHLLLLLINVLLFMLMPFMSRWEDVLGINYGYSLIWFVAVYLTGAYISRILGTLRISGGILFVGFVSFTVFTYLLSAILNKVNISIYLNPYNSPFTYVQSILLFLAFAKMNCNKLKIQKNISKIASLSMASYLLHCQEDLEEYIWKSINPSQYANDYRLLIVWFILVLSIFIIGVSLEFIRRKIFLRLENKLLSSIPPKIEEIIKIV